MIPKGARSKVRPAAARLLGLRVRILTGTWKSFGSVVRFQVQVSTLGRSLVQMSPTACCVSECDCEASTLAH